MNMQSYLHTSANEPVKTTNKEIPGTKNYKLIMALVFSGLFHSLALLLISVSLYQFLNTAFQPEGEIIGAAIKSINTLVISLAMFELGVGVSKESAAGRTSSSTFAVPSPALSAPCALHWYWNR